MKELQAEDRRFMQTIALAGLLPLAGERTAQAFYYVLKGRKANQTYQDVHMYKLHSYYRLFPSLTKERWEEIVGSLENAGLIRMRTLLGQSGKRTYDVHPHAKAIVEEGWSRYRLDWWLEPLDGIRWARRLTECWLRLRLIVQTVSHLLSDQLSFYPVVQEKAVQAWVKRQLRTKEQRLRWMDGLSAELYELFADFPQDVQRLMVEQLSGAGQAGLTREQIAYRLNEPPALLQVKEQWALTAMGKRLDSQPERFPLLARLLTDESGADTRLTASASETYRLVRMGLDAQQIAERRGLKLGTVEDHLVEIALHCPEWDDSRFLSDEAKRAILAASRRLATRRLRLIKDELGEAYSYLQIRLALARKEEMAVERVT